MSIDEYITKIRKENNIFLTVTDNKVRIRASEDVLTQNIVEEIKRRKDEIISYFGSVEKGKNSFRIPRAGVKDWYKVSAVQRRIFFIYEFDKGSLAFNMPQIIKVRGDLDKERLERAFRHLIQRHESLRTSFRLIDGEPFQQISGAVDFRIREFTCAADEIPSVVREFVQPFDLGQGPLFRVGLIRISDQEHVLMVDAHHIISDGTSQGVLIRDFMELYRGEKLPELELQYKDFAEWEQSKERQAHIAGQKEYWLREFSEQPAFLQLPYDYQRPAVSSGKGWTIEAMLSREETDSLRALANDHHTTLFMVILAGYNVLLSKLSHQEDIIVGTSVAGRQHVDLESVIGMFVKSVPLRNYPRSELHFEDFLRELKSRTLLSLDNQDVQYEELMDELQFERDATRNPWFDVMLIYQNFEDTVLKIPGLSLEAFNSGVAVSKFDLTLTVQERKGQLSLKFEYSTDLFNEQTIGRFATYLKKIVQAVSTDAHIRIGDIDILTRDEADQILYHFNSPAVSRPEDRTVVSLFEQQALLHPMKPAICCKDTVLSYDELNKSANRLAHYLIQRKDVKTEDRIGLFMERSPRMIVAMMAILKAGAAYIPVDTSFKSARINKICSNAKLTYIITDLPGKLMEQQPLTGVIDLVAESEAINRLSCNEPGIEVRGNNLAYCIYTSGSTGNPKGIEIEHQSLLDFSLTTQEMFSMDHLDHVIQQAELTFDTSVEEIFPALISGASLEILPEAGRDNDAILRSITGGATVLNTTPLILKELNGHADLLSNLRFIIVGGDAVMSSCFDKLYQRYPVYQTYGPSEVTVGITCGRVRNLEDASNLGKPIKNRKVYILDRNGALCPVSVPGELCVSGIGLARGYVNDPEQTKTKFVKNPFEPDQRMYRTGDLAKWLPDGTIRFLGRIDDQLKIRGFRIETGEIESQLLSYPEIQKAAVLARKWKNDKFIVGYYTSGQVIEEEALRNYLSDRLPHYMVPSYFVRLDEIPLTSSGKVNRRALPELEIKADDKHVAPASPEEKALVECWSAVLKVDKIGITDNYFALGGDSIKSIQISSKLRGRGYETSLKDIFTHQTIRELALRLAPVNAAPSHEAEVTRDIQPGKLIVADLTSPEIPPQLLEKLQEVYQIEDIYTLSPMQEGMLFHALIDNGQDYYFAQVVFSIHGRLNPALVEYSMNELIARYGILRTMFLHEGFSRPIQVVLKERKIDFLFRDVRDDCARGDNQQVVQFYQAQDKGRPFQLGADVLMRVTVLQTRDDEYELIWSYHHIIMDGWCMDIIFQDFMAIYSQLADGGKVMLPPAKPYARFIKWLDGKVKNDAVAYWAEYLEGYDTLAAFPTRRSAGSEQPGFTKGTSTVRVAGESMLKLNELTARLGVTLNTIVQAAWGILLSRYNPKDDVVFAAVVSGRPDEIEGVENMVGLFINSIPVRVKFSRSDLVEDLLRQIQVKALDSARHSYYPLADIQALSEMGRGLLDHIMAFENLPMGEKLKAEKDGERSDDGFRERSDDGFRERSDDGFRVTGVHEFERPNYDLWVIIHPGEDLQINLNYNAELYDPDFMQRAAGHLDQIIKHIIDRTRSTVGEIGILTVPEECQILLKFNNTDMPYAGNLLMHQLLERRTGISPGLPAVISGGRNYSYDWLNKQSNILAHYLRQRGVTCGASVIVIMNRNIGLIVALYAILKAGGKYVPIEPDLPENRAISILHSVEAAFILTDADHIDMSATLQKKAPTVSGVLGLGVFQDTIGLEENTAEGKTSVSLCGYSQENPHPVCTSEDLAYVIFTSGSTGNPKGVAVQHKPAINLIEWVNKQYGVSARDKILLVSSISFDLSVYDIFGGLAAGACIRIADAEDLSDPEVLANIVIDEGITFWDSAPAMLQQVIPFLEKRKEEARACGKLRLSFSSGDWIPLTMPPQMQHLFSDYQFVGLGGATEATIWSNYFEVGAIDPSWRSIPYGKPIQNAKYLVLDSSLNLCPIGVQGDLFIGGQCLAKEYINDEELSARKFIENPFLTGGKLYNTGDTARWFPDGNLEFMGRKDSQVKIRGYRIEPGEIESVLSKFPGINQVLAHVHARTKYDKFICVYYQSSQVFGKEELQRYVGRHLPEYMIPAYFVRIDEIPVTRNGKLDRKRLPDPQLETTTSRIVKPESATQEKLLQIWATLLRFPEDQFGVAHDFFELGGHSVMAVHLISQIYEYFDVRIKLREIFDHATIGKLAGLIDSRSTAAQTTILRLAKQDSYVTSSAQERMFFAYMQDAESLAYNISGAYEIKGNADERVIAKCLQALIDRHESLRTSFVLDENGVSQQIHDHVTVDLSVSELQRDDTLSDLFSAFVRPFDLESHSLIRFRLVKTMGQVKFFLLTVHHIVCDGISLNILMNEFKALYNGEQLQAPDTRYVDFAQWQRTAKGELERQRKYWINQLSGGLPSLALPTSRRREMVDITPAGAQYLVIDGELYKKIKQFNSGATISDFMFLLSIYQLLLSRISGSTDIIVATDAVGRTHPQLANVVGTFVNILPLRARLEPGCTFRDFLKDVRGLVLEAYDNQDFQFDWMVSELRKTDPDTPIANVHFSFANYYNSRVEMENLSFQPVKARRDLTTQYEFKLEVIEMDGQFIVQFIYSTGLYDAETIESLVICYKNILTTVMADHEIKLDSLTGG
jgi:amino acid adenylation domain-containing protein